MLTLLNVPRGAHLHNYSIGTNLDFVKAKRIFHCALATIVPVPGDPVAERTHYDPGYFYQGNNQNGQNDVEHLKVSGYLTGKDIASSSYPVPYGGTYPNIFGALYYKVPCTGWGTFVETMSIVPTMGSAGYTATLVDRPSWLYTDAIWTVSCALTWINLHCFIGYYVIRNGTAPVNDSKLITVNITVYNDDYSQWGSLRKTVASKLPVTATWQEYGSEAISLADSWRGTITPNHPTATQSYVTTRGSNPAVISDFKLERGDAFEEDLNPDSWGDLAYGCYSQIQPWDGNGLAYVKDLVGSVKLMKDTVKLAKDLLSTKNPVQVMKDLASLFLSFRYGWNLTIKDTFALLSADYNRVYPYGRCKKSVGYTYFRNGAACTAHVSVYCRPYSDAMSDLDVFNSMVDLNLTLENIWDFVPLSFVVDWFIGVGDVLDRIDTLGALDSFKIFLTGKSIKAVKTVASSKFKELSSTFGAVQLSFYKRAYQTNPVLPSLTSYQDPTQKFNHWVEASALCVQRIR